MARQSEIVGIILGGGRGRRLHPLTRDRAKPAVPLAGKYRLIDIPISNCIHSGINQIYILTQFLSASLNRHVYDTYKFDVFSRGFVELLPAEQTLTRSDWYQGTADAVRQKLPEIQNTAARDALILAGDHLYRMNYSDYVAFHKQNLADITLAAIPVREEEASRFGILKTDASHRIVAYSEKPEDDRVLSEMRTDAESDKPYLASMGIFLFQMEVLEEILNTVQGADFGQDIIPAGIRKYRVYAYPFDGYWEDIGTIRTFYEANIGLTRPEPAFDFYKRNHPIFTRSRFLPPSRVSECTIRQSVLAEGSRLRGADISDSIIGLRGVVREGSVLRGVVMMGADFYEMDEDFVRNIEYGVPHLGIGKDCHIERAIIDKNARIGDGVVITSHEGCGDVTRETFVVRDGIVVIPKNTTIPSGCRIRPQ
ncbi:glucose-1-phosphate adenylyltransferase [bacterium]|nr:glucose-1-phosphate adenylyltransferase [candidate division CSSED10-310 bacterium]